MTTEQPVGLVHVPDAANVWTFRPNPATEATVLLTLAADCTSSTLSVPARVAAALRSLIFLSAIV
jgi:hypothetical protein